MYSYCVFTDISYFRSHFQAAQESFKQYGDASELFVVIIDEIDAICKPRGTV